MERLTPKDLHPYEVKNFVDKFNDKGDDPCFRSKVIDKLWEYENAEEQGLLVRLPCKVGDKVYTVSEIYQNISEYEITGIKLFQNGIFFDWNIVEGIYHYRFDFFDILDMGTKVFLTEAEALKALKERE